MNAKIKVYTGTALVLSLLLAILKALCCLFCFDSTLGYFDNAFLVSLTNAIAWVSALWCASALFLIPKDSITTPPQRSVPLVGGLLAAVLVTAAGVGLFVTNFVEKDKLSLVCGALLFASASFFWFSLTALSSRALVCLGMLAAFGYLSILIVSHFDMFTAINSPLKMALHLSVIAAITMLLTEIRLLFGDKASRVSFVTKMLTLLSCFPTAVGHLALYASGKTPPLSEQTTTPFFLLALLGASVYAAIRLFAATDADDLAESEGETDEEKEIEEI